MIKNSRPRLLTNVLGIYLLFLGIFFTGCNPDSSLVVPADPGLLISHEVITTYESSDFERIKTVELDKFFLDAQMSAGDFRGGLASNYKKTTLYRVAYETMIPELGNQKVIAYGLVAIPEGATNGSPVLSYQHGTAFGKEEAPSNIEQSMETKLALLQFASQGYIVVAADYIGNGPLSTAANTYFIKGSSEQAMFDMHTASMAFLKKMSITPGKLFLLGWSQGGYNTLLHFRMLEKNNVSIAGVATASGPADPMRMVVRGLFARRSFDAPWSSPALSNVMFAYEKYYNLGSFTKLFIKADSNRYQIAKEFYDFKIPVADYLRVGGYSLDSIFTPEAFETARTTSHPFWELFSQAASYRWLSQAPLRQYYSNRDEVVTADIGKLAVDYQTSIGKTNATSHDAGPNADHRSVYLYSLVDVKPWFDSMK
jgi:pimeloyl-ACP methyl ester carboxylesterase